MTILGSNSNHWRIAARGHETVQQMSVVGQCDVLSCKSLCVSTFPCPDRGDPEIGALILTSQKQSLCQALCDSFCTHSSHAQCTLTQLPHLPPPGVPRVPFRSRLTEDPMIGREHLCNRFLTNDAVVINQASQGRGPRIEPDSGFPIQYPNP